jgi:hypothetical protein
MASPAESVLRRPSGDEQLIHGSGWYGSAAVLIAPPILFDSNGKGKSWSTSVLPPVPAPWVTLGFRRDNDVSWETSFLLVPLVDRRGSLFDQPFFISTMGLDIDRISTNRSPWADIDLRWQVGLRTVGAGINFMPIPVAIGPHAGLRFERAITESLSWHGWSDVGVLPSFFNGIPLVDLRGEIGLNWRPRRAPGLTVSAGLFNEAVGFGFSGGFMTPGIKTGLRWNY